MDVMISETSVPIMNVTPRSSAARFIPSAIARNPPRGCHTPNAYSRYEMTEKTDEQFVGCSPRYLAG